MAKFNNTDRNYQFIESQQRITAHDGMIYTDSLGRTIMLSNYQYTNAATKNAERKQEKFLGTPFLGDGLNIGAVREKNGKVVPLTFGYNVLKQNLSVTDSSGQMEEITPFEFYVGQRQFVKRKKLVKFYLEKIVQGNMTLYRRYFCTYTPALNYSETGYDQLEKEFAGSFKKSSMLYIEYNGKLYSEKQEGEIAKLFKNKNVKLDMLNLHQSVVAFNNL